MPRLTIVIPFLGNPALLEKSLVSVLANRPDDCEIIVVRSEVYDDPYHLQDEIDYVEAPGAGPTASVNFGIEASRGPIVHVLICGVEVTPGWADAAVAHFDDPQVAAVAPLVLAADRPRCVVAAGIAYQRGGRIRVLDRGASAETILGERAVLSPDPSAAFYRRSALEAVGGLAPDLSGAPATVDLALNLSLAGLKTVLEPESRVTAAPETGHNSSAFREALQTERLFWRWAPLLGWCTSLTLHGMVVAAECCRPTVAVRLSGRLIGCLFASSSHRRPLPGSDGLSRPLQNSRAA